MDSMPSGVISMPGSDWEGELGDCHVQHKLNTDFLLNW